MTSSIGFQLVAGRIPGERIATTVETSDSSTFTTTETEISSVTARVVEGRTYAVWFYGRISSTVNNDDVRLRMREDSSSGSIIGEVDFELDTDNQDTQGQMFYLYTEYTADATEDKTFSITGDRVSGTGTCRLEASATFRRAFFAVDYISG